MLSALGLQRDIEFRKFAGKAQASGFVHRARQIQYSIHRNRKSKVEEEHHRQGLFTEIVMKERSEGKGCQSSQCSNRNCARKSALCSQAGNKPPKEHAVGYREPNPGN